MPKIYTETEIIQMFQDCEHLNPEFKNMINTITNAWVQAMCNVVHGDGTKLNDTHGDLWQETQQNFTMIYQRYHEN